MSRNAMRWFAAPVLAVLAACGPDSGARSGGQSGSATTAPAAKIELTVYAAASTRDALEAIAALYAHDHAAEVVLNFGSSSDLAKQIVAANKADLFLSADAKAMDDVAAAHLVDEGSRRDLLTNQLAVIEPVDERGASAGLFSEPFDPSQLANPKIERLSLANVETVPAGRYAKTWLVKHGVWDALAARVLPAVDVRAALGAVESGAARAGIVYHTDVARSKKARIVFVVPSEDGPKIVYPLAVLAQRPHAPEAHELAVFLASDAAREVFESFGFTRIVSPASAAANSAASSPAK
jgi:molybdate transport system substrate-binding protein